MTIPTGSKEEMEGGPELPCGAKIAASESGSPVDGWRPIETAPKDGTRVLLWCVHHNAAYSKIPENEGWACAVIGHWIDHNGGGWTWHGLAGVHTHWAPLPLPPRDEPAACENSREEPLPSREELERALREIEALPTLIRYVTDSTMRPHEHEVLSAYDVRRIAQSALAQGAGHG